MLVMNQKYAQIVNLDYIEAIEVRDEDEIGNPYGHFRIYAFVANSENAERYRLGIYSTFKQAQEVIAELLMCDKSYYVMPDDMGGMDNG